MQNYFLQHSNYLVNTGKPLKTIRGNLCNPYATKTRKRDFLKTAGEQWGILRLGSIRVANSE